MGIHLPDVDWRGSWIISLVPCLSAYPCVSVCVSVCQCVCYPFPPSLCVCVCVCGCVCSVISDADWPFLLLTRESLTLITLTLAETGAGLPVESARLQRKL